MSNSWWANKLNNGQQPQQQPQQQSYPQQPQRPALPAYRREGLGGQQDETYNGPVTGDNFAQVAMLWKGGKGTQTETELCPGCGSNNFFSRKNGGGLRTINGSAHPMEHCFDCGYPIHQTGSGF
jgi:hypothetical protein